MERTKREFWTTQISEQTASGLSMPKFAAERGLSIHALRWWKWQLNAAKKASKPAKVSAPAKRPLPPAKSVASLAAPLRFVELTPSAHENAAIEVLFPSDIRVRVGRGFDATTLERVLDVIGRRT